MRRPPLYRWLAALPALLILFGVPFANSVHRMVLGLPFLLFWIVCCVVLTSAVMALVGSLDAKAAADAAPNSPPAGATDSDRSR
jgi:Protein of unknown function (DUF3311)